MKVSINLFIKGMTRQTTDSLHYSSDKTLPSIKRDLACKVQEVQVSFMALVTQKDIIRLLVK